LLAGCATLSKEDCLQGAWGSIGFKDGQNGEPAERVNAHAEACQQYGVAPDLAAWRSGYNNGLVLYCTRPNGFTEGVRGSAYHNVCTGEAGAVFLAAYADGKVVRDARAAVEDAIGERDRLRDDLEHTREKRDGARDLANNADTPADKREEMRKRAQELSERAERLREELRDLERRIPDLQYQAHAAEARMRISYPEWSGL
jgi:hypothetical protein